jgi:hypothetical protein
MAGGSAAPSPEPGGFDIEVLEAQPAELVLWEVGKGEPAPKDVRISNWH